MSSPSPQPSPLLKRGSTDDELAAASTKKAKSDIPHSSQENPNPDHNPPEMTHKPILQRYLLTIEYVGTRFLGWQKQKETNYRTVQGVLEDAFYKFVGKPVQSAGSSRTDTGVHALGNVCHVDVERISKRRPGEVLPPHEPGVVKRAINHFLQKDVGDVRVLDVRCVPPNFHSRFEAKERTYHYRILAGSEAVSIFEKDRAWHVPEDLDIAAMQQACKVLVGNHDFSSFRAAGCQAKSPFRTLDELHVCEVPSWPCFPSENERNCFGKQHAFRKDGKLKSGMKPDCYVVTARARSFLYHQVRLMVGLLKAVGTGALTIVDVHRILGACSVTTMPPMAPACGLYLAEVKYDFESSDFSTIRHEVDD